MKDSTHLFLDDIVCNVAELHPNKTAIIYQDQNITYGQLVKRINALAAALKLNNIGAGDFVATLLSPGLDISAALLAISKVGAIYTPLDPEHPKSQLQERIDDVSVKFILTDTQNKEQASGFNVAYKETAHLLHEGAVSRLVVDNCERKLKDPACIFFTSGTTGKAKGVLGSFEAQRDAILEPAYHLNFDHNDTLNSIARFAWSISMLELMAPLVVGGTSLILDRDVALNFEVLKQNVKKCTAFHCPPALLKNFAHFVESEINKNDDLSNIRLVWYGGDKLSVESIESLFRVFPLANIGTAYGCTEIFGLSHCHIYLQGESVKKVLIGKPVAGMEQKLVATGGDDTGEIYLGGPRVALQYWKQTELTESCFHLIEDKRYYATGDFGRIDKSGALEFVERRDAQVKIRGIRIELGEVEHFIQANKRVKEVVVLAKELTEEVKELQAFVVLHEAFVGTVKLLRSELKLILADYLLPSSIQVLAAFPLTENFKVDKKALLDIQTEDKATGDSITDAMTLRVARVWNEAAGVKATMMSDNFFDVGGNSLTAALVAVSLAREFNIIIDVADVYGSPILSGQTVKIREKLNDIIVNKTDVVYASQGQTGLIFRELFEKSHESITCTRYISCEKGFNDSLVKKAIVQLIKRFPTLNTRIKFVKRHITLVEASLPNESEISVVRSSGIWSVNGSRGPQLVKHSYKFDFKSESLIMAAISTLGDGLEVLQLTAHHVASDDNSMARLAYDFICLYDALCMGTEPKLPVINDNYKRFVEEQNFRLERGDYQVAARDVGENLLAHYKKFGQDPLLDIPHESQSSEMVAIDSDYTVQRQSFVQYVAALAWGMYQKFDRCEFVFCAHVALQRDTAENPKVGMFVNLLPLFIVINPDHTRDQYVQSVRDSFATAMVRSNVPYEQILSGTNELRRLTSFPFDAFVNELHFADEYPEGYDDIVVSRSLSTGGSEISMSVLHLPEGDKIKFESPALPDVNKLLGELSHYMKLFISE